MLLPGAFFELTSKQPSADIWVAFGTGKNFRFYSINDICSSLGEPRARALPVFHALTGCDTNHRSSKKQGYEEVTETFTFLAAHPFQHLNSESGLFQNI